MGANKKTGSMIFSQKETDLLLKIEYGFNLALKNLYEKRAANNETVVIYENGEIKHASAHEILEKQKNKGS